MINKHIWINETLYLYFDYNYEFGNFNIIKPNTSYLNTIKDYIKKIKFKGTKIIIMVGTIAVVTFSYNQNKLFLDTIDSYSLYPNNSITEKVSKVVNNDLIIPNNGTLKIEEKTKTEISTIKNNKYDNIKKSKEEIKTSNKESINKSNNSTTSIKNNKPKTEPTENKKLITIMHDGKTIKIDFEEYIIGVVSAEMPASFNIEALKAQSIIARTYALNKLNKGKILTDDNTTQNYIDTTQMKKKWGTSYDKYYNKIKSAVSSVKNLTIKYKGEYIDAVYYSTSNGYTEDPINVWGNNIPYLKSIESKWDIKTNGYLKEKSFSLETFNSKLGSNVSNNSDIQILNRNNSNRVSKIKINEKVYTGVEFRTLLGLRSTDFDISIVDNKVIITTRGYGHGVGMSQYGANEMAKEGYKYSEILKYYYQNVDIV